MPDNQSFVEVILSKLQHDVQRHDKYGSCVSEPNRLLVDVPAPSDAKSVVPYLKKKLEFLTQAGLEYADVAVTFPRKPDFKLLSPAKAKLPFLYSQLVQDLVRQDQEQFLTEACVKVPKLKDAFRLIGFWLERNQSELTEGPLPALGVHLALANACVMEEKMWAKATVLQLFKRALKWLVNSTLDTQVCHVGGEYSASYKFPDADFQTVFPICLVWQGVFNVTHNVLPSSYRLLRAQAAKALASQEDEESLLMHRGGSVGSPFERFDLLLRIDIPPATNKEERSTWRAQFVRKAEEVAEEALVQTGRVAGFGFFHGSNPKVILLGLFLNPEQTFRLLDKGPPSEDAEQSAKFREFWGELAELRRFKDGSVLESVVWEEHNRRLIPQRMMEHLLRRHASPLTSVALVGNALESDNGMRDEANSLSAMEMFTALEQRIRAVPGLPLQINHVSLTAAPSLRYTRTVPTKLADSHTRCIEVIGQVLVKFETSSRFPREEDARKKVETVLLIELAKGLETGGEEDVLTCIVTSERYMDVITSQGFAFRVRLVRSTNEKDDGVLLHTKLHNLHHSILFGASRTFGSVCRLVKRWVSGQKFSSVLSNNFVDVLVASMFTKEDPPRSGLCGLFRFFNLITMFDWKNRPLLINLEEPYSVDFSRKNHADANLFKLRGGGAGGKRSTGGPPAVVYVYTSKNDDPAVFPDAAGIHPIAWQRVVDRAQASRLYLEKLCMMESEEEKYWTALFASDSSEGFDAVLFLDLTANGALLFEGNAPGAVGARKKARYQNLVPLHLEHQALVGVDPLIMMLRELRREFDQYALFFAGEAGNDSTASVGVVWKQREVPFTLPNTLFATSAETADGGKDNVLQINEQELVHAMVQLGHGIITSGNLVL
ncbi:hypothetical protein BASA81_003824 [Batrachochytrium salamandrivorans]|nr:hypothetical protein BASA81_003824 [Batrachochytrium salamandrivorans]